MGGQVAETLGIVKSVDDFEESHWVSGWGGIWGRTTVWLWAPSCIRALGLWSFLPSQLSGGACPAYQGSQLWQEAWGSSVSCGLRLGRGSEAVRG